MNIVIDTPTKIVIRIVSALPARYLNALTQRLVRVGVDKPGLLDEETMQGVYNPP